MRQAARMLSAAALEALALVEPGGRRRGRLEVELALRRAGFSNPAFETIVASGPEQRAAACPSGHPGAHAGRRGGAGLRGRLRRILRGFDAHGPAGARQADAFRRIFEAVRGGACRRDCRGAAGVAASAVDAAAREALARAGWATRSCTARAWPGAGSARGAADHAAGIGRARRDPAAGHGVHGRAGRVPPGRWRRADRRRRAGDRRRDARC